MKTPTFAEWYEARVGISLEAAKRAEVYDLPILEEAWNFIPKPIPETKHTFAEWYEYQTGIPLELAKKQGRSDIAVLAVGWDCPENPTAEPGVIQATDLDTPCKETIAKPDSIQQAMCVIEENLNHILEHVRDGKSVGNFDERIEEVRRHTTAAKAAFNWLDNFTITQQANEQTRHLSWNQCEAIHQKHKDGITPQEIAVQLGIKLTDVTRMLTELEEISKFISWEQCEAIHEKYKGGANPKEIAAQLGLKSKDITRFLTDLEETPPSQIPPSTTITREWMDWAEVTDMNDIAASRNFQNLISHPDFETARGWMIHGKTFLVIGDNEWWGWETPGGSCMMVGTLFPKS